MQGWTSRYRLSPCSLPGEKQPFLSDIRAVVGKKKARRQFCTTAQGQLRRIVTHKLEFIVREKGMVARFRHADETPARQ